MTPLPKRRISKTRRRKRRTHQNIGAVHLVDCGNCGEKMLPHRMCPNCRQYQGRQVLPAFED